MIEKGEYLAELMRKRSPSILVKFYTPGEIPLGESEAPSKEEALQKVAKELVSLHH